MLISDHGWKLLQESIANRNAELADLKQEYYSLRGKYTEMMKEFTVLYGIASTVMPVPLLEEVLKEARNG